DDLLVAAHALVKELTAQSSAVTIAISRRMLWEMYGEATLELAREVDSRGIFHLGRNADLQGGPNAFLAKRLPEFPMRVSRDLPEYFKEWLRLGSAKALVKTTKP